MSFCGKSQGGSFQQSVPSRVERVAPVHQKTVVPHDDVTDLPVMRIDESRLSGMFCEFKKEFVAGG